MSGSAYWYLSLIFVSMALLAVVLIRTKAIRALLLFLMMTQIAFLIETVIYIFGSSYFYRPGFIQHSEYYDSNLGALTSNMAVIPAVAVFIASFRLGWPMRLVFIGVIAVVEWVFVKLGLYSLTWWRIEYTALGLLVYLPAAEWVNRRISRPAVGGIHTLLLFLATAPILGTLHILPIILFGNRAYHPGWFSNPDHDTTAFASLYYLGNSLLLILAVKLGIRMSMGLRFILLIAVFLLITVFLQAWGLLEIRDWWDPWFYCLFPAAVFFLASAMDRRLAQGT
ncbi:hypothetical protein [Gorillibacterium sp. sgz5001074]|uniref:hypothetical protein n=1 Tax=Gorillibacterium sp. sgz5001074 TaxID=3446695 RepID=UPI003F666F8F